MKFGIIGAGITGLTLAHSLLKAGHQVVLYDKGTPGGLAGGFKFPDISDTYLEKYYHHIFKGDKEVIRLIDEMGLKNHLRWLGSRSGLYASGRIWPFETPMDLLRFRHIRSPWQRLKMGFNIHYFKRQKSCEHLDDITCRDFFAKRRNSEGFDKLWRPLLNQKFGRRKERIPASFLWGRINPRASSRENGREILGYLMGGFPKLFDALVESIGQRGGRLFVGEPV